MKTLSKKEELSDLAPGCYTVAGEAAAELSARQARYFAPPRRDKCPNCGKAFSNKKAMLFHYNICGKLNKRG